MQKLNKEELKREPMDDGDIRHYLGNESRIISYSDLNNFNTIEEILPRNKTYFILLYQLDSPSSGHWAIISRMNDIFEYFCSYGKLPDYPILHWAIDEFKNVPLKLSSLLDHSTLPVVYNSICFQNSKNKQISTCGGFVVFRALTMLEFDATLGKFNMLLQQLKNESEEEESFDDIVIKYINYR